MDQISSSIKGLCPLATSSVFPVLFSFPFSIPIPYNFKIFHFQFSKLKFSSTGPLTALHFLCHMYILWLLYTIHWQCLSPSFVETYSFAHSHISPPPWMPHTQQRFTLFCSSELNLLVWILVTNIFFVQ